MAAALTKGVTYTSIGYGYPVLPKPWRLLVSVEALTGIRMCGLFFALLTRIHATRLETAKQKGPQSKIPAIGIQILEQCLHPTLSGCQMARR